MESVREEEGAKQMMYMGMGMGMGMDGEEEAEGVEEEINKRKRKRQDPIPCTFVRFLLIFSLFLPLKSPLPSPLDKFKTASTKNKPALLSFPLDPILILLINTPS